MEWALFLQPQGPLGTLTTEHKADVTMCRRVAVQEMVKEQTEQQP